MSTLHACTDKFGCRYVCTPGSRGFGTKSIRSILEPTWSYLLGTKGRRRFVTWCIKQFGKTLVRHDVRTQAGPVSCSYRGNVTAHMHISRVALALSGWISAFRRLHQEMKSTLRYVTRKNGGQKLETIPEYVTKNDNVLLLYFSRWSKRKIQTEDTTKEDRSPSRSDDPVSNVLNSLVMRKLRSFNHRQNRLRYSTFDEEEKRLVDINDRRERSMSKICEYACILNGYNFKFRIRYYTLSR